MCFCVLVTVCTSQQAGEAVHTLGLFLSKSIYVFCLYHLVGTKALE